MAPTLIEQTEALHVVDVNSGNRSKSSEGQEVNALDVNLGAADELARQLRLRDMGGIIVVDLLTWTGLPENRQKLYERMVENMRKDRAKHSILPLSKFGLMQITRQRVRPVMDVNVEETCPTCGGTGKIKPSILFYWFLLNQDWHFGKQTWYQAFPPLCAPVCSCIYKSGIFLNQKTLANEVWYGRKGLSQPKN